MQSNVDDLNEARAELNATLDALPDLLFELDRSGKVFGYRASRPELLHIPAERFLGKRVSELLPKEAAEVVMGALAEAEVKGRHHGAVYRIDTPENGVEWYELSVAAKLKTSRCPEMRFVALVHDITTRKKAEEALRQSEARYRAIFETTGTATVIFDNDGIITLASKEFVQVSGYTKEEIEGKMNWRSVVDPSQLERMNRYDELRRRDPGSAPSRYEMRLLAKDGRLHDGVLSIGVIPGTTERVVSFLDVTELKRAQEQMFQAEKMAALGQIVAGVAHEINNPNNFIYFNLPILRRYLDALRQLVDAASTEASETTLLGQPYEVFMEDVFKLLDNMEHGSKRIAAIVDELKAYLRGHDEEMRSERIEVVINRVMTLVGKQVRKMVKRFDVNLVPGLPPITMNTGKIEQVIINLLINAAQAADKESSWVELTVKPDDQNPNVTSIVVEDNGVGIPREHLHRIFEPFFTSKSREGGTGLGLSICQRIVEEHGGRIRVTSTHGSGTRFVVELPSHHEP